MNNDVCNYPFGPIYIAILFFPPNFSFKHIRSWLRDHVIILKIFVVVPHRKAVPAIEQLIRHVTDTGMSLNAGWFQEHLKITISRFSNPGILRQP